MWQRIRSRCVHPLGKEGEAASHKDQADYCADSDGFMCSSLTNIGNKRVETCPPFRQSETRPRFLTAAIYPAPPSFSGTQGLRMLNACFAGVLVNEIGLRPWQALVSDVWYLHFDLA
jgi:hypothetical protein